MKRLISCILVISFLLTGIEPVFAGADTLATPSIFQKSFPDEKSNEFKSSAISDIKLFTVATSVGNQLFAHNIRPDTLPRIIRDEFRNNPEFLEGIKLDGIKLEDRIATIPFERKGMRREIRICPREKFDKLDTTNSEWGVSEHFGFMIAGTQVDAPLIGRGFTKEEVEKIAVKPWRESGAFKNVLDEFESVLRERAPDEIRERMLAKLSELKEPVRSSRLGLTRPAYKNDNRYYLGFGTKRSLGLSEDFVDPNNNFYHNRVEVLFHELFHSCFDRDGSKSDIEENKDIHLKALRHAAVIFWGLSEAGAGKLSLSELESHAKNKLGSLIREWKARKGRIKWLFDSESGRQALGRSKRLHSHLKKFGKATFKMPVYDANFRSLIESAKDVNDYVYGTMPQRCGLSRQGNTTYYQFGSVDVLKRENQSDVLKIIEYKQVTGPEEKPEGSLLIYYSSAMNCITMALRGADLYTPVSPASSYTRGEADWDRALVRIYLDQDFNVSMINHEVKTGDNAAMGLSRATIPIMLHDAGADKRFKSIFDTLDKFLVFPKDFLSLRYKETKDSEIVPLTLIDRLNKTTGPPREEDIEIVEGFRYYKSWVVKRYALWCLRKLFLDGHISKERFERSERIFIEEAVIEDMRFIQRKVIQDPDLAVEALRNIYNINISKKDIEKVSVNWYSRGGLKNVYYTVTFRLNNERSFDLACSTIRSDDKGIRDENTASQIDSVIVNWNLMSSKGYRLVPKIGAVRWVFDFRPRITDMEMNPAKKDPLGRETWIYNNINIVFREFVEGQDLKQTLADGKLFARDKAEATRAALQAYCDLWNESVSIVGKRLYIGDPKPANVVPYKDGDRWKARLIDLDMMKEGEDFYEMSDLFSAYPEYNGFNIVLKDGKALVEERSVVKSSGVVMKEELRKMDEINVVDKLLIPPIEKGKTLWHVISANLIPQSSEYNQRNKFTEFVRDLNRRYPDVREKIEVVTDEQLKARVTSHVKDGDLVDVALGDTGLIDKLPDSVKMLVFEARDGGLGTFRQLEGILACLRALQIKDPEEMRKRLEELYELLTDEKPPEIRGISDMRELARKLVFRLPAIDIHDGKALKSLEENLHKLIESA